MSNEVTADYPGAHAPDRRRIVDSAGVLLSVAEWGAPDAPPVLMAHGGFDFARTLDVFAPLIVAGGWRVVSWDQRGHGDSAHAELYSWDADVRDAAAVLTSVSDGRPIPIMGHSKGGGLVLHLADALPHRVSHVVNLDGLPSRRNMADVSERERTRFMARELGAWLDHRLAVADKQRRPGTIQELAERRARMNTRLSPEWLRYLVTAGARHDADGWRWKLDPSLRFGGFGPWRPEWQLQRIPGLSVPFLGVLGLEKEAMGWGTRPSDVTPYLPRGARFEALDGVGHFVHIEQPRLVADMVLDFLGTPSTRSPLLSDPLSDPVVLRHYHVLLALHQVRPGDGHPLLLLHGLGEATRGDLPPYFDQWPGPIWGLDFTGHGASSIPVGGGYTAEILLADANVALTHIGEATVFGRGLGAWIALLLAGARPALVRGAILFDGPGLVGGGTEPGSSFVIEAPAGVRDGADRSTPDPFAVAELARDVRPPDYAASFVRFSVEGSDLPEPITVSTVARPEWLVAVAAEPGVADLPIEEALALYSASGSPSVATT